MGLNRKIETEMNSIEERGEEGASILLGKSSASFHSTPNGLYTNGYMHDRSIKSNSGGSKVLAGFHADY